MNKILEKVLEDFKRANLKAKEKMAAKYGFEKISEFEDYLNEQLSEKPKTSRRKTKVEIKEEPATDMVIAFDTTGSMSSYLNAVRAHVEETVKSLFANTPNLRLKIVAFGDYCDMVSSTEFGKAYQETALTDNTNELIKFIREAKNTSGGDGDEFYELVLKKILDETSWREGSNRSILLVADSDPHPVGYSFSNKVKNAQIDWRQEAIKANSMKVRVDTMRIHPYIRWYEELSMMTEGACMNFRSSGKTQDIVEGATYFTSGSKMSMKAAKVKYRTAMDSGDDELVGAYKSLAKSRGINLDD